MKNFLIYLSFFLLLVTSSCSSKMYSVYYDPIPPKTQNYLTDISVKEHLTSDNSEINFLINYNSYGLKKVNSGEIMERKVIANYTAAEWLFIPYAYDIIDFLSIGYAFSRRLQKESINKKEGFKSIDDNSILKIEAKPQFGLSLLSIITPFYTAPFLSTKNPKYENIRVTDINKINELSINKEQIKSAATVNVPVSVYCNNKFITKSTYKNIKIDLKKISIQEYNDGQNLLEFKILVGSSDFEIDGSNEFIFAHSLNNYLPESYSITEYINTVPSDASIYFSTNGIDYEFIGKSPYKYSTPLSISPQLPQKKIKITKSGYETEFKELSASNENRNINVELKQVSSGYLKLTCNENDVQLFIDGEFLGTLNNYEPFNKKLTVGEHLITAKKEYFKTVSIKANIKFNEIVQHRFELVKASGWDETAPNSSNIIQAVGKLTLATERNDLKVYIDGATRTLPFTFEKIAAGEYNIRITGKNVDKSMKIIILDGQHNFIDLDAEL